MGSTINLLGSKIDNNRRLSVEVVKWQLYSRYPVPCIVSSATRSSTAPIVRPARCAAGRFTSPGCLTAILPGAAAWRVMTRRWPWFFSVRIATKTAGRPLKVEE